MYCTTEADHNALISVQNSREITSTINSLSSNNNESTADAVGKDLPVWEMMHMMLPNEDFNEWRTSVHLFAATTIPGIL
jgi:hypothetical protein